MTKEHFMDEAFDELSRRTTDVMESLKSSRFKNTKPFRREKPTQDELLNALDNLTPEEIQDFINRYGYDNFIDFANEMNQVRMRRYGYA